MRAAPLLLDIGSVSDCCTDVALEALYKAAGDPPGDDPSIWRPHESPLIRDLVEHFSSAGTDAIARLQSELKAWFAGQRYIVGAATGDKPPIPLFYPWPKESIAQVEAYLATKAPATWKAEDVQALVDMLVQKHLPADLLASQAEKFIVQSYAMGGVQAAHGEIPPAEAVTVASAMPGTVEELVHAAGLADWQLGVLDFARRRCVDNVVSLTNGNRMKLRRVILDHQEAAFLGDRTATTSALESKLLDTFGTWNRDWRRIAVSEAGENLNQGLIATVPHGTFLKRVEMYAGACAFCKKIDGRVLKVVAPDAEDKNGESEVWVGKTNIGRAAAPNKRVGGLLVPRLPSEMWWVAAGIVHPHCRGRWTVLAETKEKVVKPQA
jgi:hypothetical protein